MFGSTTISDDRHSILSGNFQGLNPGDYGNHNKQPSEISDSLL
jgi:hypothetical protein